MLITALLALRSRQVDQVVCGMAAGWDLCLGAAALTLGIPVVCAKPFSRHRPGVGWGGIYNRLELHCIDEVIVMPDGPASEAFKARNRWMVDHSHAVFALWNGRPSGTEHCIRYAESVSKPVFNFYDQFMERYQHGSYPDAGRE